MVGAFYKNNIGLCEAVGDNIDEVIKILTQRGLNPKEFEMISLI